MNKKDDNFYKPESTWAGRSLENYKKLHINAAKDKGNEKEFLAAKTLTAARKLAFGLKKRNSR